MRNYYKYNTGGAEYQAYMLAQNWSQNGNDVHFIFFDEKERDERMDGDFILHSITKIKYAKMGVFKAIYWWKIYRILSEIKPDVIYHRDLSSILYVANIYVRRNGAKTVLHLAHEKDLKPFRLELHPKKLLGCVEDYFKKSALQKADAIIAQTSIQQSLLEKNYNRKASVIHNIFEPLKEPSGVLEKKDIIVWIGNIKPIKNPLAFLEIVRVLPNHKNFRFVMIGRPPTEIELKNEFYSQLQETKVEYLGEMSNENVNEFLLQSKILCCTSFQEGFPNTFLQAWAREVTVVSLYVDPDNIITSNDIGFVSGSIEKMSYDLNELITKPVLLKQLGARSREYVENHHSIDALMPAINEVVLGQ